MADNLSFSQRQLNMSRIKSKDTQPEVLVRKYLFSMGFRYRKNVRSLQGCPDIVLPKYKTVIFVNGCFWHMHDCGRFKWPDSNRDYWEKKIYRNIERDKLNKERLALDGWNVLTVWECQLKKNAFEDTMNHLKNAIVGNRWCNE